jgi:sulfite reductase beta subunit-like hemoprotein
MSASPLSASLAELLQRVREEYREMPNLRLTPSQATRLFGVEPAQCAALLDALVNEHFLTRTADGLLVRSASQ